LLLSVKLCKVLDAGLATIEEIAVESGYPVDDVQALANGLPLNTTVELRHRIGRALAPHFRGHPELYRDLALVILPSACELGQRERIASTSKVKERKPRGVFELESECDCWKTFLIRDSRGVTRRVLKIPTPEFKDEDVDQMWGWLNRHDRLFEVI
jgi:hypothetical protein